MTSVFRRHGRLALMLVLLGSAMSALVMTAVFAHPAAAPSRLLGSEWECGQLFWVTSCTRVAPISPASRRLGPAFDDPANPQPV